jgi:mannan endo-1,4-beta-mannosidase
MLSDYDLSSLCRQGKPEVLTAMELVPKDFWQVFVPYNATCPFPDTIPCRKETFSTFVAMSLITLNLGGVQEFQRTYAFTSWAGSTLHSVHQPFF